jgi:hypothetical protein
MKLCPLFAKIIRPSALKTFRVPASAGFAMGIAAAQEALPRGAIEEAISVMEIEDISPAHIEQLRALLPEGD